LFLSCPPWLVEDHKSGYRSGYDILLGSNLHGIGEENEF
jgi:hypothetical protein